MEKGILWLLPGSSFQLTPCWKKVYLIQLQQGTCGLIWNNDLPTQMHPACTNFVKLNLIQQGANMTVTEYYGNNFLTWKPSPGQGILLPKDKKFNWLVIVIRMVDWALGPSYVDGKLQDTLWRFVQPQFLEKNKQTTVFCSSSEAEYWAMPHTTSRLFGCTVFCPLCWSHVMLLLHFTVITKPVNILQHIAANLVSHERMKYRNQLQKQADTVTGSKCFVIDVRVESSKSPLSNLRGSIDRVSIISLTNVTTFCYVFV